MSNRNSNAVAKLSQAQLEALAAQALQRNPLAQISLWPNRKQREGKRDADLTGRLKLSTVQLAEKLAAALAAGETEVELWIDVWQNEPSVSANGNERPILSGRSRSFVEQRTQAEGDAQSDNIISKLRESLAS